MSGSLRRSIFLYGAAVAGLAACAGSVGKPAPLNPVRFLLVNDVYVADTMADGKGGLARVATVRRRLADQGPVLFVLAGDVLSPSLLSKYYSGRQMVEAFNAAKLDYATFGNHEFELPLDTLEARIAESNFKWISSNCAKADGTPFAKVLPWDTVRVSGHKVGLFGLTLQGGYRKAYLCPAPDSAAHRAIDTLVAQGAELVVGLTHQTIEADRDLLAREPRLDLILGGHEHERHDSVVSGRHVLKADANSRSAQFVTLWGGKGEWRQAVGLVKIDNRLPDDTAVAAIAERWEDSLRARLGPERVVARTAVPIDARDEVGRREESLLGDLVTDAMRWGTSTDVALLNAGTLRLDDVIRPGPISNYQLESIFLFPGRDPGADRPAHRRPAPDAARARRGRRVAGKGAVPAGLGGVVQLRSQGAVGQPDQGRHHAGVGGGDPGERPAPSRHPGLSRVRGGRRLRCARGPDAVREPGVGPASGGPADQVRDGFAGRAGRGPADGQDHPGWKHKSRLSWMLAGTGGLSDFAHPGRKAEIPGAPKGYALLLPGEE